MYQKKDDCIEIMKLFFYNEKVTYGRVKGRVHKVGLGFGLPSYRLQIIWGSQRPGMLSGPVLCLAWLQTSHVYLRGNQIKKNIKKYIEFYSYQLNFQCCAAIFNVTQ
jgi:hypothetical protein